MCNKMNKLLEDLLISGLVVIAFFNIQCINKQIIHKQSDSETSIKRSAIFLIGTDIYNGSSY